MANTEEFKFTKQKLLKAEKYAGKRDVLQAILEEDKLYSTQETDQLIIKFLRRTV